MALPLPVEGPRTLVRVLERDLEGVARGVAGMLLGELGIRVERAETLEEVLEGEFGGTLENFGGELGEVMAGEVKDGTAVGLESSGKNVSAIELYL